MLFDELVRIRRSAIMSAIVLAFLGNVFMLLPTEMMGMVGDALGFALLVVGVEEMLEYRSSRKALIDYVKLVLALVGIAAAFVFLTMEGAFVVAFKTIVGFVPIVMGLVGIYVAFVFARRAGRKGWQTLVVLAGLLVVFGVFTIISPFVSDLAGAMRVASGTLMFSAILSILSIIWIWPSNKEE